MLYRAMLSIGALLFLPALTLQEKASDRSLKDYEFNHPVSGNKFDYSYAPICQGYDITDLDSELKQVKTWLIAFRDQVEDTKGIAEHPFVQAFIPAGYRNVESLQWLTSSLAPLIADLTNRDKQFANGRPDIPVVCPQTKEALDKFCAAKLYPGRGVLGGWTMGVPEFPHGVMSLCPAIWNVPTTEAVKEDPLLCKKEKALGSYKSKALVLLHELMHSPAYLDTDDVYEAYGPFCCKALANCHELGYIHDETALIDLGNSDSITLLITSLWWEGYCKDTHKEFQYTIDETNFKQKCPKLYEDIYDEDSDVANTASSQFSGGDEPHSISAVGLMPSPPLTWRRPASKFAMPSYCKSQDALPLQTTVAVTVTAVQAQVTAGPIGHDYQQVLQEL